VSLFSPWSNFGGPGVPTFPFPSPSLGFTIGDAFVPWSDAVGPSGLTPTPGQNMSQGYPMHAMHHQLQGGGEDRPFIKQETPFLPFSMNNMDGNEKRQGPVTDLRKDSTGSVPGSVSRVDSSSSGASAASIVMDGNVRTPTPLFKSREPLRSFDSSGSYFTYPRPGGGDQMSSSYQPQTSSHGGEGSLHAVQPSHLFHLNRPFQAGYTSNQYMSVPPGLTQQSSHHYSYMHQPDRQNSRESTSSEVSSISPAMLSSRAPRTGSPVSMLSDDALNMISAQTSPRSQAPLQLPGTNPRGSGSSGHHQTHTSGPGSLLSFKRGSASSMHTDVDGEDIDPDLDDEADGVEKNGMMWGMPTAEYRSLSARERKRVRNRISARTFRARRKGEHSMAVSSLVEISRVLTMPLPPDIEHLSVLEQDLNDRKSLLKASQDEIKQLREENAERECSSGSLLLRSSMTDVPVSHKQFDDGSPCTKTVNNADADIACQRRTETTAALNILYQANRCTVQEKITNRNPRHYSGTIKVFKVGKSPLLAVICRPGSM
jgi:hypothetical protein